MQFNNDKNNKLYRMCIKGGCYILKLKVVEYNWL